MFGGRAIGSEFSAVTGLPVTVDESIRGSVRIVPADLEPSARFAVLVSIARRRLSVEFVPGNIAGPLVEAMGRLDDAGRALWCAQLDALGRSGCTLDMTINNAPVDPTSTVSWPETWRFFSLRLNRNLVAIEPEDLEDGLLPPSIWVGRFAALLLALLPLTQVDTFQFEPDVEGDRRLVSHFRAERSPRNRAAAIAIHGTECKACGLRLDRVYGEIARDFIHIHHLTPLSEMEEPGPVDPERDLVPLCPNCHGVAHRRNPPYTLEELRLALGRQ